MKVHDLKTWPEYFAPVDAGVKSFEAREDDRGFNVGDVLRLMEYDDRKGVYTGAVCFRKVTYIMRGIGPGGIAPLLAVRQGYCVMSLAETENPYGNAKVEVPQDR